MNKKSKTSKLSKTSRIIIAVGSLGMIAAYFLPVWFIFLLAPQYPEGLTMQIWLDKITGQVEIINGLNHYIGMKKINVSMFPEFDFLVYILGFYILAGLIVAITGKRKILTIYLALILVGGAVAMVDFYMWGYDYGHNLDPTAPIQVPGLSYQPPLIGHKKLLNFDAYSYPDVGGWVIIAISTVFFGVWFYEWKKNRKKKAVRIMPGKMTKTVAALLVLGITSCTPGPEPIQFGKDLCADCKMTIMDPQFGGEIITEKGKVFKFDDVHCVLNFMKSGTVKEDDIAQTVFVDYEKQNNFLNASSASFVISPELKSPMGSNAACFSSKEAAERTATANKGNVKDWNTLKKEL